ncbi:O-antigen ligase family protein [Pontixanthobacter sp. CEM42]|uniref:O-antigen ligase family protein n=1 Tax=Pontixanthobacter sp. CEM42 TaxID=2792077 RepID=UPI001ADFA55F|nr:O-antigen ligase family protein [Pontixanthobacter sp. CEM42]
MKIARGQQTSTLTYGWIALGLFAVVAALLGGSSRYDAVQITVLRPLAALFLIPALYFFSREKLADLKTPAMLLGLLALWMVIQLIPLPPGIWQSLPGREPVAAMGAQVGQPDLWRPISMVPSRGYNALFSLLLPGTALLLFAAMGARRAMPFLVLIGLGAANALLGILQVVSGESRALFFYEITNFGSAVGFFANHNHSAVFAALTLLVIAYVMTSAAFAINRPWQRFLLGAVYLLVLLVALVGGSRAGLLTTIMAVAASGFLFRTAWKNQQQTNVREVGRLPVRPGLVFGAIAIGLVAIVGMFAIFDRIPALARVTEAGTFEGLRWILLPVLREMVMTYGLFGAGFGSFEELYHIHEPASLMFPSYVNQAHNDLAQLIIEGGLPAVAILIAFLVWAARAMRDVVRSGHDRLSKLVFWLTTFAIIIFASLFDYPLRTPLFQVIAIWLVAILSVERATAIAHR